MASENVRFFSNHQTVGENCWTPPFFRPRDWSWGAAFPENLDRLRPGSRLSKLRNPSNSHSQRSIPIISIFCDILWDKFHRFSVLRGHSHGPTAQGSNGTVEVVEQHAHWRQHRLPCVAHESLDRAAVLGCWGSRPFGCIMGFILEAFSGRMKSGVLCVFFSYRNSTYPMMIPLHWGLRHWASSIHLKGLEPPMFTAEIVDSFQTDVATGKSGNHDTMSHPMGVKLSHFLLAIPGSTDQCQLESKSGLICPFTRNHNI